MESADGLIEALRSDHGRVACAESMTGGLLAARLTAAGGASDFFEGGLVLYSDAAKARELEIPLAALANGGPVTDATARAMAIACRERFGVTLALATTGYAGPDAPEGQRGLVFVGASTPRGCIVERHLFEGDRDAVRLAAVDAALALGLRALRP